MVKKILFCLILSTVSLVNIYGQENSGTPYSSYGFGYIPDNEGIFTQMGGVSAAMRSKIGINYLNPASYTALDSNRFYFQVSTIGEYGNISTSKDNADYRVARNTGLNMAFRANRNIYLSLGFTSKADIGYDLLYTQQMAGNNSAYFEQNISGEGGIHDIYLGLAWKIKNLSLGLNASYLFGKIERRETLISLLGSSYYIETSDNNSVRGLLFNPAFQYEMRLSPSSKLTLGASMNFTQELKAKQEFISYKVNTSSGDHSVMDSTYLDGGYINYPMRITGGINYTYKDSWNFAADYTYQKMSDYEEFGENDDLNDYYKINAGLSWRPIESGRFLRQRTTYSLGGYYTRSAIEERDTKIKCYGVTLGTIIPFTSKRGSELGLGVSIDLGIRGTRSANLIQEKYAKLKLDISLKEFWFGKRKIY